LSRKKERTRNQIPARTEIFRGVIRAGAMPIAGKKAVCLDSWSKRGRQQAKKGGLKP